MSLHLRNLSDGSTQDVATGAVARVTLQAGLATVPGGGSRGLFLEWDSSYASKIWLGGTGYSVGTTVTATVAGDLSTVSVTDVAIAQGDINTTGANGSYEHLTPA